MGGMNRGNEPAMFEAVIFDMDGVVTDTMEAHFTSWKGVFDVLLQKRNHVPGNALPLFLHEDYFSYVDGMPRFDGIRRFLKAKNIELPEGADDDESIDTIHGLGNLKNKQFHRWLDQHAVPTYQDAVVLIKALKGDGLKLGIFSSSRNAKRVLDSAGMLDLFDARVDGNDLSRPGLKGKPSPDMLLENVHLLGSEPARSIVIEDAVSGVTAGAAGGFGFVIGVDREWGRKAHHAHALRANGADLVTHDLHRLVTDGGRFKVAPALPTVWTRLESLGNQLGRRPPAIFLDYDGTLTPIVEDYREAWLDPEMVAALEKLARVCKIAIISGRGLADLRRRVKKDNLYYAGSHGFEIAGPEGVNMRPENAVRFLRALDSAEQSLRDKIAEIAGAEIERKPFGISAHYRRVAEKDVSRVERIVDKVAQAHQDLRKSRGKKVFQLQPRTDWNKGDAVQWLLAHTALGKDDSFPVYLGDDITDEDAFSALAERGIGIIVREDNARPTTADYALEDPEDAARFLTWLADNFNSASS